MTLIDHPLRREQDWWEVRDFLVATFSIAPPGHIWEVRRWDGMRFHESVPWSPQLHDRTRIWREDGRIVAVATQEGRRDLAIQIHPDRRHLEPDLIAWGEEHLALDEADGRALEIQVFDYDIVRTRLLGDRGYRRLDDGEVVRRIRVGDAERRPIDAPEGYRFRGALVEESDADAFAVLLNESFGRTEHTGSEVMAFRTGSPSYDADLDLMAETDDGTLVASVGITVDGVNHAGIFEPVLTHPDHRRRGLAVGLMRHGLHLMKSRGAATAWVGTGLLMEANALYDAVGFTEVFTGRTWRRAL